MVDLPDHIRQELEKICDDAKAIFDGTPELRVTLIIRSNHLPEHRDVVISDDDLNEVAGTLQRDEYLS